MSSDYESIGVKMFAKVSWFLKRIFNILIEAVLRLLIKRDGKFFLFGAKPVPPGKDIFLHNTKYLFLYIQEHCSDIKSAWLCDDKQMLREFHKKGYKNVYSRHSLKGIYSILKAKYWFCDYSANQVSQFNSAISKATIINFWHGSGGLKKVGYDENVKFIEKKKISKSGVITSGTIIDKIYQLLKVPNNYYPVSSKYEADCRKSAFKANDNQIVITGSPRVDVLYSAINGAELFMEEDFNHIKQLKESGKRLLVYMPTFRDTGIDISSWLKSEYLKTFLKKNNTTLLCKLHPFDTHSLNFDFVGEIYKMSNTSDIYPILKYTDGLITDYSSIYFDYLHLDKPILYYIPDFNEYSEQCHEFYEPYENLTAGIYARTEEELLQGLTDIINGVDNCKEMRKALLDRMFVYQDGNNCKRNLEFIKEL